MKRGLILAASIAFVVILTKLVLENLLGIDLLPAIRGWIATPSLSSALVLIGLLLVDLVLPIPSSPVMVMSGAVFGALRGGLLSFAGSLACSLAGFEIARRFGARGAARLLGDEDVAQLEKTFQRQGAGAVFVTRSLPVVKETLSVVAGLSRMKRSTYWIAATAGTIPEAFLCAYAGAASREIGNIMPAVLILMALAGVGWMYSRRHAA
jgi:uncharacterized membrane protein YdjX (TVP38/TMEM64 family)